MIDFSRRAMAVAVAAALSLGCVGCAAAGDQGGQEAAGDAATPTQDSGDGQSATTVEPKNSEPVAVAEPDPTAGGRIDVTQAGEQVATFHGDKYIVSDATVEQRSSAQTVQDEGLGLQEICVVHEPDAWKDADAIAWDRNSITYHGIPMSWGHLSLRYQYINEQGVGDEYAQWSRTTEEGFFTFGQEIEHMDVDGHTVAYMRDEVDLSSLVMQDLAQDGGEGADDGAQGMGATVMVFGYEQRAEKCAFSIEVTCEVDDGKTLDLSAEELLRQAYAPLEFVSKDSKVNAASYVSDVTITTADGAKKAVVGRKGDVMISYTPSEVVLLEGIESVSLTPQVRYSMAPVDAPGDGAESFDIDGRTVKAQVREQEVDYVDSTDVERIACIWVDMDGTPLYVEASMAINEDLPGVLERVVSGRVTTA